MLRRFLSLQYGKPVAKGSFGPQRLREAIEGQMRRTQTALLEQDRIKHDTYAGPVRRGLTTPLLLPLPTADAHAPQAPGDASVRSSAGASHATAARYRCNSDSPALRAGVRPRQRAYLGIDWYQIAQRRQRFSLLFFLQNLYFWCYAGYIVACVLIGGIVFGLLHNDLDVHRAVYTSASCVSQSGLAVQDWSQQTRSTYVASFVLIIMGSMSLLHLVPVILRILSFRMQARMTTMKAVHSPRRRNKRGGIVTFKAPDSTESFSSAPRFAWQRSKSEDSAPRGEAPPWARHGEVVHTVDSVFYGMKAGTPKRSTGGSEESIEEMHRSGNAGRKLVRTTGALPLSQQIEYKALIKIMKVMLAYWFISQSVGASIFYAYFRFGSGPIQSRLRSEGISPVWNALYLAVSAFQNNGLVLTPSSVMEFNRSPVLLNTIGALILLGNTALPIMIRSIVWCLRQRAQMGSVDQKVLDFLLDHPRRCFTHLFPAVHTVWLLMVVVALGAVQTAALLWEDSNGLAFAGLDAWGTWWNALFMAISTRTAGMNSVNVSWLSQPSTFLMAVMMYVASTPTVVIMRFSALQGAQGGQELDITGRPEGVEEEVIRGDNNTLKLQAKRYLTQDVTYLIVAIFLICCFEKENFGESSSHAAHKEDGVYGSFTFFKVLFEVLSAYGTCGLSLGFNGQSFSFSGVWSPPSQYLLVVVMILGRLRGLPDSIDPSVRVAMAETTWTEDRCTWP